MESWCVVVRMPQFYSGVAKVAVADVNGKSNAMSGDLSNKA